MPEIATLNDPWETPPDPLDPDLVTTSQQLMAKSDPLPSPEPLEPPAADPRDLEIRQLEEEKQRLFQRNVSLVAELAQLRVANQRLLDELAQLKQPRPHSSWLARFWPPFR